jgi:hypothetical protein
MTRLQESRQGYPPQNHGSRQPEFQPDSSDYLGTSAPTERPAPDAMPPPGLPSKTMKRRSTLIALQPARREKADGQRWIYADTPSDSRISDRQSFSDRDSLHAALRGLFAGGSRNIDHCGPASAAGVRAADMPGTELHVDPRILGMGSRLRRLLLGSRNVGDVSSRRPALDPWLLGLE